MVQNQEQPVGKITFSILIALSLSHCLNDLLQSVLSASYPLFKDDLGLSFAQIGLINFQLRFFSRLRELSLINIPSRGHCLSE